MTTEEIIEENKKYSLFTWSTQSKVNPMVITGGKGIHLYDNDGNDYIDLCSHSVNCNVGNQHPYVIKAIHDQLDKMTYSSPSFATEEKGKLSKMIIDLLPDSFAKVLYTNGGADAVENAVKIARMYTGRNKVISRYRSYHGCTMGAGAITGDPRRWACEPGVSGAVKVYAPNCFHCPFRTNPDECSLQCALQVEDVVKYEGAENIAAIVVETVAGANGMLPPPKGYLQKLRDICDKTGILLIFDEVMAGFGRTGKMFAFENYGVVPDILCLAKGLTSGYISMGAVVVNKKISDYFEDRYLCTGLTYSGHSMGCAAAIACIEVYKNEKLPENAAVIGKYIFEKMAPIIEKHPIAYGLRGIGLMIGFELVYSKDSREPVVPFNGSSPIKEEFFRYMLDHKIIMGGRDNLIVIAPPLVCTKEDADYFIPIIDEGLSTIDKYART